jgi:hypothetical protein
VIAQNEIRAITAPSVVVEIYIAGPVPACMDVLAERAAEIGACWSVEPVEFVYTGGRESGCVVRSINYPRFPNGPELIMQAAVDLGKMLIIRLHQASCCVVGPTETVWLTRRGVA